jgi:WD repeat and SOF domain-containing protein 1
MEAFNFTVANEDSNCYTFDMRKLDIALNVHRDHVAAVMSVDYSPTGKEFVTGSYDRTVRLFGIDAGHSREVYHTKRMQRIFSVRFSADNKYILSGSDDTNIRLWKVSAHERIRTLLPREQSKRDYLEKLKERYKFHKETARIARHRHIPKPIYNAKKRLRIIVDSKKEKLRRIIAHSKPGAVPTPAARKIKIVKQFE